VTEVWLGVIAVAMLVMAIVQVSAMILAVRAVRQMSDVAHRVEHEIEPILSGLQTASSEAARAMTLGAEQVNRAGRLIDDLARRVDHTARTVQESVAGPFRDWAAVLQGVAAGLAAFWDSRQPVREHGARSDEEDALFIG
jgi:hypothetical protein